MISDAQARRIAAEWHGGQSDPLYALASSGAITSADDVIYNIDLSIRQVEPGRERRPLLALRKYVQAHDTRGPQDGWSDLWDETEPNLDDC